MWNKERNFAPSVFSSPQGLSCVCRKPCCGTYSLGLKSLIIKRCYSSTQKQSNQLRGRAPRLAQAVASRIKLFFLAPKCQGCLFSSVWDTLTVWCCSELPFTSDTSGLAVINMRLSPSPRSVAERAHVTWPSLRLRRSFCARRLAQDLMSAKFAGAGVHVQNWQQECS